MTLSHVGPNSWIPQSVHVTYSGGRAELRGTSQPPNQPVSHLCLQVSGARWVVEPSMSRAGLPAKAGVSELLGAQGERRR